MTYNYDTLPQKIILNTIILIICAVPLVVWPYGTDYFYYPKICIIYFLLAAVLLISFASYKKRAGLYNFSHELIPVIIFIGFMILSTVFSPYLTQALWGKELRNEGAFTYISYLLILYFTYNSINSEKDIKKIIIPLLISSSVISAIGILQYVGIDIIPKDSLRAAWVNWSFSTLGNPDFVGSYLSIIFPASLSLYLFSSQKKHTVLLYMAAALSYGALICTQARSAWIGVALSLFLLVIIILKSIPHVIMKLSFFIIGAILITFMLNAVHNGAISSKFKSLVDDYKNITSSSNQEQAKSTAGSQRIFIWDRTMDYIFDRPLLGTGPDTFDKVFKMSPEEAEFHFGSRTIYVDKAHNEYLQIAVTLGFPAVISYLIFLAMILSKSILSLYRYGRNKYILCLVLGVFAYMVQAFFNISVVSVAPVFWSMLGLLMGVIRVNKAGFTNKGTLSTM